MPRSWWPSMVEPGSVSAGATRYYVLGNGYQPRNTAIALVQSEHMTAGTISNLGVYLSANTSANGVTFDLIINSVGGNNSISIPNGSTGFFQEDEGITDTITSGQLTCYRLVAAAGSGSCVPRMMTCLFTTASDTVTRLCGVGSGVVGVSENYFLSVGHYTTLTTSATEANAQVKLRTAGTIKNLQVYVGSNSITAGSNLRLRVNSSSTNPLISGFTGTGQKKNTSTSSAVVSGDNVCWYLETGGTGTSLQLNHVEGEFVTTNRKVPYVNAYTEIRSQGTGTHYFGLSGTPFWSQTTNLFRCAAPIGIQLSDILAYVDSLSGSATITMLLNGSATGMAISVPGTGWVEDSSPVLVDVAKGSDATYSVAVTGILGFTCLTSTGLMSVATQKTLTATSPGVAGLSRKTSRFRTHAATAVGVAGLSTVYTPALGEAYTYEANIVATGVVTLETKTVRSEVDYHKTLVYDTRGRVPTKRGVR